MKLTTRSEYSLLALIYIARHQKQGYVKIEDICNEYQLPKKYLEQLFLSLKQARLIMTRRGAMGGYKLAMPASKITIADVVRLMDGALAPTLAVSKYFYEQTPLEKEKKILNAFAEIRDYVSNKVEKLSIANLV